MGVPTKMEYSKPNKEEINRLFREFIQKYAQNTYLAHAFSKLLTTLEGESENATEEAEELARQRLALQMASDLIGDDAEEDEVLDQLEDDTAFSTGITGKDKDNLFASFAAFQSQESLGQMFSSRDLRRHMTDEIVNYKDRMLNLANRRGLLNLRTGVATRQLTLNSILEEHEIPDDLEKLFQDAFFDASLDFAWTKMFGVNGREAWKKIVEPLVLYRDEHSPDDEPTTLNTILKFVSEKAEDNSKYPLYIVGGAYGAVRPLLAPVYEFQSKTPELVAEGFNLGASDATREVIPPRYLLFQALFNRPNREEQVRSIARAELGVQCDAAAAFGVVSKAFGLIPKEIEQVKALLPEKSLDVYSDDFPNLVFVKSDTDTFSMQGAVISAFPQAAHPSILKLRMDIAETEEPYVNFDILMSIQKHLQDKLFPDDARFNSILQLRKHILFNVEKFVFEINDPNKKKLAQDLVKPLVTAFANTETRGERTTDPFLTVDIKDLYLLKTHLENCRDMPDSAIGPFNEIKKLVDLIVEGKSNYTQHEGRETPDGGGQTENLSTTSTPTTLSREQQLNILLICVDLFLQGWRTDHVVNQAKSGNIPDPKEAVEYARSLYDSLFDVLRNLNAAPEQRFQELFRHFGKHTVNEFMKKISPRIELNNEDKDRINNAWTTAWNASG